MTVFWLVAALFLFGALLFLLPPLVLGGDTVRESAAATVNLGVMRDQMRELERDWTSGQIDEAAFAAARQELERRALTEPSAAPPAESRGRLRGLALGVGIIFPILAVGLYGLLGTPDGVGVDTRTAPATGHAVTRDQVVQMVAGLAQKLRANPDDPEGWMMLARSYTALGRYEEAVGAFRELTARVPDDPQILADYADTLAMARGRSLLGEPEGLVSRALAANPNHGKALALAGTIAFSKQDYRGAIGYWERILPLVAPDSPTARSINGSIADARSRLGGGAVVAASPRPTAPASATTGAVAGRVQLVASLAGRVRPDDTVFIFARAAQGPRMPLAILRKKAADLPLDFALDDSLAMNPAMRLSSFPRVVVGARISRSGNALPATGDLEGQAVEVDVGARGVEIRIDREVP